MLFDVYTHEPLAPSGWQPADTDLDLETAATVARSWAARGWRVAVISAECREWQEMNLPQMA
jgi:hypothetical protein